LLDAVAELSSKPLWKGGFRAMKVPTTTDARVVRTRAALRDALIALVGERGWDAIGVRDICVRAKVGRSTFYTHFADPEEVLMSGYEDLGRMLRAVGAQARAQGQRFGFVLVLLEHAKDNQHVFRALVGKRSSQVVQRRMLELVVKLTAEELAAVRGGRPPSPAVTRYLAGALFGQLVWWVESRCAVSAEDMEASFQKLTAPVLRAIG
jgi:AcrR family transcriptional regulator